MTEKLKCPICSEDGVLILKTTVTNAKGHRYEYQKWYVYHNKTRKQRWCYLAKEHLDDDAIKRAIADYTKLHKTAAQNDVAFCVTPNNPKSSSKTENTVLQWCGRRDLDPGCRLGKPMS